MQSHSNHRNAHELDPADWLASLPPQARDLGAHAAKYLKRGWFVVPLNSVHDNGACRCPKGSSCSAAGKHPLGTLVPRGWKDASTFPPTVARWLRIRPQMNLGVALGPSGLASLDVDPRNGGDASLAHLIDRHGPLPETLTLVTGGGGFQYIFSDPERTTRKQTPIDGIDILGRGSLSVAPPSRHRSGRQYRWDNWPTPLAPVPPWMTQEGR